MTARVPRVLAVAGTDPTGGAGQHADLKSIAAMGGYGMSAVTAVVVQNTVGVRSIHVPPVEFLSAQLDAVAEDVEIDAVKIGMLGSVPVIEAVTRWLVTHRPPVVVLDPVMVATSGGRLLEPDAEDALRSMLGLADLITPNLQELAVLAGEDTASSWEEALAQGHRVARAHGTLVLVKGGHLTGDRTPDALVGPDAPEPLVAFDGVRVPTENSHGTGCSLSSALATLQARHGDWPRSLRIARDWLRGALEASGDLSVGHGSGPVHHFHHVQDVLETWGTAPERFSDELWEDSAAVRREIEELEFVRRLGDGRLEPDRFLAYLDQDLQYLDGYSRALALLAAKAPDEEQRLFFAAGAVSCTETEAQLHRARLRHAGDGGARDEPGEVTRRYTTFLLAATAAEPYPVGLAAVLPCYWVYADVGRHLGKLAAAGGAGEHPYADWLATYADEEFQEATRTARRLLDDAARDSPADVRERMREVFLEACALERDFFAAPVTERRLAGIDRIE
ncbi:bifunctional hydroxymethylpyrimidine kinase/phosphomethylpyrimidine kinase [uncultured Kocuria sp.]|uniref:bifunctional hydroxymethylpyrimidine kinase/phosphomethylpyrimidine kinase n=1 Tax=uncultured Kocuria sp. TaxID=259305 RepID=UPI00261526AF|nr:bifunctional hydroxymethylpyrimidine kinase/phosphomethylpyrimidine kinase [uncultured Kocuria sp.]